MTQQRPITPPPELVQQWWEETAHRQYSASEAEEHVITSAAQWGADQELEACCRWIRDDAKALRIVRRPEPPSLKEQAMQALCRFMASEGHEDCTEEEVADDFTTIRRALEQLND